MAVDGFAAITEAFDTEQEPQRTDVMATVRRIAQDGTVYVHFDGGPDETPMHYSLASVKPGDVVPVRISGGKAWIPGNRSDVPASSYGLAVTNRIASDAQTTADIADENANEALTGVKGLRQHFWHDANGAHVRSDADSQGRMFRQDMTGSGNEFIEISGGVEKSVANFGGDGARVGEEDRYHVEIEPNGLALGYGGLTPYELRFKTVFATMSTGENVALATDLPYTYDFGDTLVSLKPKAQQSWSMFPQSEGTIAIDTGDTHPTPKVEIPESLEQYVTFEDGVLTISEDAAELIQSGYNYISFPYEVTVHEETDDRALGMYVGGRGTLPTYYYDTEGGEDFPDPGEMPSLPSVAVSSGGDEYLYIDDETAVPIGGGGGGLSIDDVYPVGSIYMSVSSANPGTLFSGTTWQQISDTFLLAAGSTYAAGTTGGEAEHTLTAAESGVPVHSHGFVDPTYKTSGSDGTHRHQTHYNNTAASGTARAHSSNASGYSQSYFMDTGGGHGHTITKNTSGSVSNNTAAAASAAHNNMPPYLAVYIWKRTA